MTKQSHSNPLIGSWRIALRPDGQSGESGGVMALLPGGIVINVPPAVEPFPLAEDGSVHVSSCLGAWSQSGERSADIGFVGQAVTSRGLPVGFGSVRASGRLERDDEFTGRYHFEIAGADGVVFATEDGDVFGARITAEAPEQARHLSLVLAGR